MSNYSSHPSYNLLRVAREEAAKSCKYKSEETRVAIISKFKNMFNGKQPYNWQINTCEALLLGLDCIVIAGIGAGKSFLFMMPLLMDSTCQKMVIVISPLNMLEYDQVHIISIYLSIPSSAILYLGRALQETWALGNHSQRRGLEQISPSGMPTCAQTFIPHRTP